MRRLVLVLTAVGLLLVADAPTASADLVGLPLPTPLPSLLPRPVPSPVPPLPGQPPIVVPPLVQPGPAVPTGAGGDPATPPAATGGPGAPPEEQTSLPEEPQRRQLESQQAAISDQAPGLDEQYGYDARAVGGGDGVFAWPLAFRGHPPITQRFGCTTLAGEPYSAQCGSHRTHTGLDLGAGTGTPVRAAAPGVARTFRAEGGYGNYVLVVHGNGWLTLYGHLSGFAVLDGQLVSRGQPLGTSGSTGFSTGPHLHFEVRHGQTYLDPCDYLNC